MRNSKDFEVISYGKEVIKSINKITYTFPNKEKILRDRLNDTAIELLKNVYYSNNLVKSIFPKERIRYQTFAISDIKIIDLLLEISYTNGYIGEKDMNRIGKDLKIMSNKIKGWTVSEMDSLEK